MLGNEARIRYQSSVWLELFWHFPD